MAIETLREGGLVVARDEENGVSGVFPVTSLMSRTASKVLWLTLENEASEAIRMGACPALAEAAFRAQRSIRDFGLVPAVSRIAAILLNGLDWPDVNGP